ncbi:DUF6636 domain-containing protein [Mycolicibacterium arenosum]|uniref:Lipoprotein LppU n=1 Tax=Mycolicibacterium arenosum TaxID=2952157 RepID=A0ABT1M2F7_9MYCO|nr:DUF6636 domain-containing protein [Mycolicibacterium sp. CAU 1645]MCP9272962.1 hypothetical protein [Mycolicibacterium sp. CAU 1645]
MTLRCAVVMLAVAGSVLAGCGDEKSATATPSESSMSRATAPNEPTSDAASASRPPKTVATTEADDEELADLVGFTSPTGAIGCVLDDTYVRCDVSEQAWTLPPRPADCEFDYGQGVSMSAGEPAEVVCAGDTTANAGPPLAYGQSVTVGSLSCESAETGVTCRDADSGHGFTVARETYTIF